MDLSLMHYSSQEVSHKALFWVPSFSCCTLMIFHLLYQKACNVDICADDTTLWQTSIDPTSIQHGLQSSLIKADHWSSRQNKMMPNAKKTKQLLLETKQKISHCANPVLNLFFFFFFFCEELKLKKLSMKRFLG